LHEYVEDRGKVVHVLKQNNDTVGQ